MVEAKRFWIAPSEARLLLIWFSAASMVARAAFEPATVLTSILDTDCRLEPLLPEAITELSPPLTEKPLSEVKSTWPPTTRSALATATLAPGVAGVLPMATVVSAPRSWAVARPALPESCSWMSSPVLSVSFSSLVPSAAVWTLAAILVVPVCALTAWARAEVAALDGGGNRHRLRVGVAGDRVGAAQRELDRAVGDARQGGGGAGAGRHAALLALVVDAGDLLGAVALVDDHWRGHAGAGGDAQRLGGDGVAVEGGGAGGGVGWHGDGDGGLSDGAGQARAQRVVADVGRLGALDADVDGLVGVGADLELGRRQATVEHVLAVELGAGGDAVQLGRQGGHLVLDRLAVGIGVGSVGGLDGQHADALQQVAGGGQAALSRLRQGDAVVGVLRSTGVARNLCLEALRNGQAGRIVFRAVDPQAGGQALQRGLQRTLRFAQVVLRIQRGDVGIDG